MSDPKKLIVVLGAHRSGTSLCAAAVQVLGADACLGEHYANEENQKGFFEHPDVVDFNDRLLAHLGGSWDNPLFIGADQLGSADVDRWQGEAVDLLADIYGETPLAVIKDPRIMDPRLGIRVTRAMKDAITSHFPKMYVRGVSGLAK